jgi:hypothetical protein
MSKPQNVHDASGVLVEIPGIGIIQAWGEAAPTDAVSGYAKGCAYQHIGGEADNQLFLNEGTLASATWVGVTAA